MSIVDMPYPEQDVRSENCGPKELPEDRRDPFRSASALGCVDIFGEEAIRIMETTGSEE